MCDRRTLRSEFSYDPTVVLEKKSMNKVVHSPKTDSGERKKRPEDEANGQANKSLLELEVDAQFDETAQQRDASESGTVGR